MSIAQQKIAVAQVDEKQKKRQAPKATHAQHNFDKVFQFIIKEKKLFHLRFKITSKTRKLFVPPRSALLGLPIHYQAFLSQPTINNISFFRRGSCWLFMYTHITFIFVLSVSRSIPFDRVRICSGSSLALISSRGFIDIRTLWLTCVPLSSVSAGCVSASPAQWFRIDNAIFSARICCSCSYHIPGPDSFFFVYGMLFILGRMESFKCALRGRNWIESVFVERCTFYDLHVVLGQTSRWIMARRLWKGWLDIDIRRTLHLLRHFRFRLFFSVSQSRTCN